MTTRRRFPFLSFLLLACFVAFGLTLPAMARTHSRALEADAARLGVAIQPLSHGDLMGMAAIRDQVEDLAARYAAEDPRLPVLLDYASKQFEAADRAFWPGSVSDENHPFHVPVHAYMAADRYMLTLLGDIPGAQDAAARLERGMMLATLAAGYMPGALCIVSYMDFNTANSLIRPSYLDLLGYRPYQYAAGFGASLLGLLGYGLMLGRRRELPFFAFRPAVSA